MEEKNKKILLIIAILFMVVLTITYSSIKMKKIKEENTHKEQVHTPANDDVPIENYVPKDYSTKDDDTQKQETKTTIDNKTTKKEIPFDKLEKTLKDIGYTKAQDDKRCLKDEKCFVNKVYFIHYSNVWLRIEREIKANNLKDYDSKGDLLLIGKLVNDESLSKRKKIFNELFHKFNHTNGIHDFFIHIDGYIISTYYSLNNTLEYSIGTNYNNPKEYDFTYLDTILNDTKSDKANKIRKELYEFSIKNKKEYFPYYDLASYYFDLGNNELCDFEIEYKNYIFRSSFCHGGTSNTLYEFETKENYKNQDTILITVRPTLFEKDYLKLLQHDLKYINDKTNNNFKLTKTDLREVKKVVSNTKESYTFVIDYKLEVTVSFNKNSKFYTVKYLLNK